MARPRARRRPSRTPWPRPRAATRAQSAAWRRQRQSRSRAPLRETPADAWMIRAGEVALGLSVHDVGDGVGQGAVRRVLGKTPQRDLGLARELGAAPLGVVDAAGLGDDSHDLEDQLVLGLLG